MEKLPPWLETRSFFGPSRVIYGWGAAGKVGDAARELGAGDGALALLVTDETLHRLGAAAPVQDALRSGGLKVHTFTGVKPEPTLDVAEEVTQASRALRPAVVVGIGGGSVMDMAKLAAVMPANPGSVADYIGQEKLRERAHPLILVPTTAGTGAESSRNAVVTINDKKAFMGSQYLVPQVAVLDPSLTVSLPPTTTAWTGVDALSHCVEGLISATATPLTDAPALAGVRIIREHLTTAYHNGQDRTARASMMVAAYLGGLSLNALMVIGHSIAYTIANRLHLHHGLTCAIALPYTMVYNVPAVPGLLARVAEALGVGGGGEETAAWAAVRAVVELNRALSIPMALRDIKVERSHLPEMARELMERYPRPNNPRPVEYDSLLRLYEAMWEGNVEARV
ncbi:MAG: iron-containing alcohol dehydrogenase [Armatimonadetes bacterium]|nr:iron-containing alcohol dehydrogenase [Armatimonadota bacterium]